jgi:hypothetical protein
MGCWPTGRRAACPPDDLALAIPAETLRQRPDVRAAEHRIAAALARVAQADAARYPDFRISGTLGLRALTVGALTGGSNRSPAPCWPVSTAVVRWWRGACPGACAGSRAGAGACGYEATVLTALKDVEDALVALRGDRERLVRLQAAADAAGNAALLAQQRYSSGLIDFHRCWKPSARCCPPRTAWRPRWPAFLPTMCGCTRRWAAAGNSPRQRPERAPNPYRMPWP